MSDVILSIRSLTRKYEDFNALQGIDLEIKRGEFVALLGPSGCGKTTLLRCIGGFTQPTSGEILIDGASMLNIPPQQRPVNTVFQNYALFPHMTVAQNVAYGPRRAKDARQDINKRVMESLEMVGLASLGDRYPTQLSGGQQQRVALARAIINRPQVLLLDEPLGALDLKLRKHMQLELKKLQQQLGITFVFVTHDQEEALVMADRIAVMNGGRLEQLGTGEQLYHTPASLFVADFIGDANFIDVDIESCGTLRQRGSGSLFGRLALPPGRGAYRMLARPSQLSFVPPDCTNTAIKFQAMVMRTVSTGDALRVFVKLADGAEVAIKLPESVGQLSLHEGQSVHLGLLNPTPNFFPINA